MLDLTPLSSFEYHAVCWTNINIYNEPMPRYNVLHGEICKAKYLYPIVGEVFVKWWQANAS